MATKNRIELGTRTVKIRSDLVAKAKVIAEAERVTLADYLSGLLRPLVERDFGPAIEKIQQQSGEANGHSSP